MPTTKVTFTLDELALPKSEIVREAIPEFYDWMGRLSLTERLGMLRAFDELVPKIPAGPARDVDHELAELRKARRGGGRRTVA